MLNNLDRLKALNSRLEEKLIEKERLKKKSLELEKKEVTLKKRIIEKKMVAPVPEKKRAYDTLREENIQRVHELYRSLEIYKKSPDFDNIFLYKAMNLSGIGLKEEDFAEVRPGKYIQVIAITYEPDKNGKKKAKNVSLGYFGKGDNLEEKRKNEIIEFVLCWRYEKAFQNLEHYKNLIARVRGLIAVAS